jgi:hypothetical protein
MVDPNIDILFVAWQDPAEYRYWPVARLIRHHNGPLVAYEFAYVHGAQAAQAKGFQPFLAFPEINKVYRGDELFPFFANRLLSPSRPDFAQYVERLRLDPATPDPFAILARSGAVRATDCVELFPYPSREPDGGFSAYFCLHGIRRLSALAQARAEQLRPNDRLQLPFWDPANLPDDRRICLLADADIGKSLLVVGYVPGYLVEDVRQLIDRREYVAISVFQVNPPPAPLQQRVLCEMRSQWPNGFVPFSTETYAPLNARDSWPMEHATAETNPLP